MASQPISAIGLSRACVVFRPSFPRFGRRAPPAPRNQRHHAPAVSILIIISKTVFETILDRASIAKSERTADNSPCRDRRGGNGIKKNRKGYFPKNAHWKRAMPQAH